MAEEPKQEPIPRAAVAVIVIHEERILFGQRIVADNDFEWQIPGGWIRNGETPEQAAKREVEEETGLKLVKLEFVAITNNIFSVRNHSISLCFEAECSNPKELGLKEPEKCLGWQWNKWHEVDANLFLPLANLKKSDYRPFIRDKRRTELSF